jgi:hypothetical protein
MFGRPVLIEACLLGIDWIRRIYYWIWIRFRYYWRNLWRIHIWSKFYYSPVAMTCWLLRQLRSPPFPGLKEDSLVSSHLDFVSFV